MSANVDDHATAAFNTDYVHNDIAAEDPATHVSNSSVSRDGAARPGNICDGNAGLFHPKQHDAFYKNAAIYLLEGEGNDSFITHPSSVGEMRVYSIVHSTFYRIIDLLASSALMILAIVEHPGVANLTLSVWLHSLLELMFLAVLAVGLVLRLKWLTPKGLRLHPRITIKLVCLAVMFVEAMVMAASEENHMRLTRAMRPLFLLDSHYLCGARRVLRQIIKSLRAILSMLLLLHCIIFTFSVTAFFLFHKHNPNFKSLLDSFVSLFVLMTTANFPDVMMPSYEVNNFAPVFFAIYLFITLYLLLNLLLAIVFTEFQSLERRKFRNLFLHKRMGVKLMYSALQADRMGGIDPPMFFRLMQYYRPMMSFSEVGCSFKLLNKSESGILSLEECYDIYEVSQFRWSQVDQDLKKVEWFGNMPPCVFSVMSAMLSLVRHRLFRTFTALTIAVSAIWMSYDAITWSGSYHESEAACIVILSVYIAEICLKMCAFGFNAYVFAGHGWNLYDIVVVTATFTSHLIGNAILMRAFLFLRTFRLVHSKAVRRFYQAVLGTADTLLPHMGHMSILLIVIYYVFAIFGMELFAEEVYPGCCNSTSLAAYYSADRDLTMYYYLNNFNDILRSYVTLFELMVINNWHITMNAFVYQTSQWARLFFLSFFLVSLIIVTTVIAFIIELFTHRLEYRKETNTHTDYRDRVTAVLRLTRQEIFPTSNQENPTEMLKFKGVRPQTKLDYTLHMYKDEIEGWCAKQDADEPVIPKTLPQESLSPVCLRSSRRRSLDEELLCG